jgi:oligopeptidase B
MFVSTGLRDSQVQYWEPAEDVARLRTCQTGDHPILLRTQMAADHDGASGRFRRYRLWSEVYACLLDQLGVVS